MRYLGLLLLTGATSLILPLSACAQGDQSYMEQSDPMVIPPGMQAVAVTTRDLPAGVDRSVIEAVQASQQAQQQQQTQNAPMINNQEQMQNAPMMSNQEHVQNMPLMSRQEQIQNAKVMNNQQLMQQPVTQIVPASNTTQAQPQQMTQPMPQDMAAPKQTEPAAGSMKTAALVAPLPVSISHGITYTTGGTNEAEIEQLKTLDNEFNLQILFAAKNGDHLMNYAVRLLDYKNFELVSTKAVGPYLYLHINPGDYVLEVTHEQGMTPSKMKIKVPAKNRLRKTILLK